MPKATSVVNALTSGEWSPKGKGRFDLAKYSSGAAKIENFLINQLGGVSFRPGLKYLASTKDNGVAKIFPFQYSADQDYVVEAGDQYFRLYSNGADLIEQTVDLTKLLLPNDAGVDGSKEFIDSGNTGHVVSTVATAQMSTLQKKFGSGSLLLDGNSDYLTVPDHADWDFGTGSFTVDFWIRMDVVAAIEYAFITNYDGDWGNSWGVRFISGTGIRVDLEGDNQNFAWSPVVDTWYHVTVVGITGANVKVFIDGTQIGATWAVAYDIGGTAADLVIGRLGNTSARYMDGYMDEIRVSKGVARWSTDFTAPTAAHTSDANTSLLLHCNSQDASASFHRTQFQGTALLDTDAKKFGTASLLLDGDSDYLQISDSAEFDVIKSADDNWTIDLWVKFADHVGTETLIVQWEDANNYWLLQHVHGSGLRFIAVSGGVTIITTGYGGEITDNTTFHHIAVCKRADKYGLYKDGTQVAYVQDSSTDTFAGDVYIGATGVPGDYFQGSIDDVRIINSNAFSADPNADNTDTIVIPTSAHTAAASQQTEISTPYVVADVFDLQVAQYNDVMYIVHPDYAPRKLSRTGASAFSLSLVSFVRAPLKDTNTTATTITPSADTGAGITLTASTAIFDVLHIGAFFRVKEGMVKITAYTSTTVVTGDVEAEPDGTAGDLNTGPGAVTDWAEGAFSDYRGWPSAIAFHEQKLYYANTDHEPQKFWGSYTKAYDSFDTTATTANYSLTFEVATEQRNAIRWLSSGNRVLSLGTIGGTFSASAGDTTASISPTNIVVKRDTNYGVASFPPKRISSYLYYIQRDFSRLRELSYSFQVDSTISSDMTLLAEHILKDGGTVVDLDHQQSPNDRIYCVREDGEMSVLTRNPEQEVMGWCRFVAGADAQGNGTFESVAVIPKSEEADQVWVVVKRNINGTDKRFIEYFSNEDFDEDWDAVRVDSSLTLDSPITITGATVADPVVVTAVSHGFSNGDQVKINGIVGMTELNGNTYYVADKTDDTFELQTSVGVDLDGSAYTTYISGGEVRKMVTAITGLDHLEGETVYAQVDGYIPSTETYLVSGGGITLSAAAAVVHVGLRYVGTIQLLKLSDGSPTGTGQSRMRRIFKGTLRLDRTQGLSIGRDEDQLESLSYVDETDDEALFTGDMAEVFQTTWNREDEIYIKQTKPLPANILAIILRSAVEEG